MTMPGLAQAASENAIAILQMMDHSARYGSPADDLTVMLEAGPRKDQLRSRYRDVNAF